MAGITPYEVKLDPINPTQVTELADHLMRDLSASNAQAVNTEFMLSIHDNADKLIGGLTASTSYGWMLIKVLWVDQSTRRTGLGSQLMDAAMKQGRDIGCHGIWLDTSSPQAYAFYKSLGFKVFGMLENEEGQHPAKHKRWMMRKRIKQEGEI
jgi:GNAT superfamily N-acetyltransferase